MPTILKNPGLLVDIFIISRIVKKFQIEELFKTLNFRIFCNFQECNNQNVIFKIISTSLHNMLWIV